MADDQSVGRARRDGGRAVARLRSSLRDVLPEGTRWWLGTPSDSSNFMMEQDKKRTALWAVDKSAKKGKPSIVLTISEEQYVRARVHR